MVQANFARSGRLAPEVAALLSRLMTFRQDADYTAEFVFTPKMAADEVSNARTFVEASRAILGAGGWTKPSS